VAHGARATRPQRTLLRFCVVDDLASLVWVANQAAIELHPFTWRVDAAEVPTQIVFDLDPGPPAGLVECAVVALRLRPLLVELDLEPLVKTTGSLGLHVQAPLPEPLDAKLLARDVAGALATRCPELVVTSARRAERAGRVYVDWLQNDPTRQNVAPYSLRGVPGPLVATPVRWGEVERAASSRTADRLRFGPEDVRRRIHRDGDLFEALR
jgi:bifunctional non-homologous end joining protein LigD